MSDELQDPVRLLEGDEASLEPLRRGLGEARAQGPSPEQLARVRAGLGLPPAMPESVAPTTGASGLGLKLVVSAVALTAALGSFLLLDARAPAPAPIEPAPAPVAPAPMAPAPGPDREPAPGPAPAHAAEAAAAPEASARPEPDPRVAPEPKPRAKPAGTRAKPATDPAAELSLLKRARSRARSAPAQALSLVAEHERRFGDGAFVQEREVIAVDALLAAGRVADAKRRAARFHRRFPGSAHARRMRALFDTNPATSTHAMD